MNLYLIRHAHAVAIGVAGARSDEERPLSPQGVKQAETLAPNLQRQGVTLEMLVTSPLLRARQTAEAILKKWTDTPPALHISKSLSPEAKPRKLASFLEKLGGENIGIVGHDPHLNQFGAWLMGSKKAKLDIAKGGVALITIDDAPAKGSGTLQWLVTPKWLGKEPG